MSEKEAYQEKMDAQLREWQAKIDVLKAKADQAGAEQKIKYQEELETLRAKREQVQEKLDELRSASEDAWQDLKAGVETSWQDLRSAVDKAAEQFK